MAAKPLVGFEVLPLVPKQSYDRDVLIYAAYIGSADGTVQLLAFYLSTRSLGVVSSWIDAARRITATAVLGKADFAQSEKTKLAFATLRTPKNWITIVRHQDLVEVHMHEVLPLGTQAAQCVLHTGALQVRPTRLPVKTMRAKFPPIVVTWSEWTDDVGPITSIAERFTPKGERIPDVDALLFYGWCRAPTTARLADLRDMFEDTER